MNRCISLLPATFSPAFSAICFFASINLCAGETFSANPPAPSATATPEPTPAMVQFLNISTRLPVRTGDNVGIAGFVVRATEIEPRVISPIPPLRTKRILVRAIGPSLNSGTGRLAGALQDPILELHDGSGNLIAANDNWKTSQQSDIQDSGLAPSDDRESAIIADLLPDQYTAVIRGTGGTTGIGLVEAYDVDNSEVLPLVNISTRGKVETGENILIAGVIAKGAGSVRYLFRGIGPELTANGVFGALADPTLQVFDSNGNSIASNDNWKDSQQQEIALTGIQPTDDHESAILAKLSAGSYTVVMRGKNNMTGVGLVEIYNLDTPAP